MIYNITCNTDDNYAQHCCAMLCSLFENNKDYTFSIHILSHSLSAKNSKQIESLCSRYNQKLQIYDVDESRLEGVKFREKRPLTKAAYYRILLPEILGENITKILYLDCDIIILNKIVDIYDIDISNYALAACVDSSPYSSNHRNQLGLSLTDLAFCSGVMLLNLEYWRSHNALVKLLEFSKRERVPVYLHDQDSLNFVFKNQWFVLPPKWNRGVMSFFQIHPGEKFFDYLEYDQTPQLIHYASNIAKPWYDVYFPERKYYLKYLYLSGFEGVKFDKRSFKQKIMVYESSLIYFLNKYIRPFVPNFIEIILKDTLDIIIMIGLLMVSPLKLNNKILKKRISKKNL